MADTDGRCYARASIEGSRAQPTVAVTRGADKTSARQCTSMLRFEQWDVVFEEPADDEQRIRLLHQRSNNLSWAHNCK